MAHDVRRRDPCLRKESDPPDHWGVLHGHDRVGEQLARHGAGREGQRSVGCYDGAWNVPARSITAASATRLSDGQIGSFRKEEHDARRVQAAIDRKPDMSQVDGPAMHPDEKHAVPIPGQHQSGVAVSGSDELVSGEVHHLDVPLDGRPELRFPGSGSTYLESGCLRKGRESGTQQVQLHRGEFHGVLPDGAAAA